MDKSKARPIKNYTELVDHNAQEDHFLFQQEPIGERFSEMLYMYHE